MFEEVSFPVTIIFEYVIDGDFIFRGSNGTGLFHKTSLWDSPQKRGGPVNFILL